MLQWRPVRLEAFQTRIDDIYIQYSLDQMLECCEGTISTRIDGIIPGSRLKIVLQGPQGNLVQESLSDSGSNGLVIVPFTIQDPCLWNPHGYGGQHQYSVHVNLYIGEVLAQVETKRFGIRKAEVIEEDDDFGKSFYFRINGIDIFAGGSCWIPADMFPPKISTNDYREWLTMMVQGNQIMIRYALQPLLLTAQFHVPH